MAARGVRVVVTDLCQEAGSRWVSTIFASGKASWIFSQWRMQGTSQRAVMLRDLQCHVSRVTCHERRHASREEARVNYLKYFLI